ncbi:glycosyltransferase family 2 protein [Marinobacter halodurans]|uniref:glycosyltransferase family 2 protein n=1 Tax=Marinobacter halodurans TaxID=2528979 RepID=UPI0013F168D9|nr:glycosyltransferase [Marinobacter halodurans]
MKRVSVIIPAYNAASKIDETIASVLDNISAEDELLIIDDCSSDETQGVVEKWLGSQVRYHCLQKNSGGPATPRNVGINLAEGEFISIFDSDDLMYAGKLDIAVNVLSSQPDLGLVFSDFHVIDEDSVVVEEYFLSKYDFIKKIKSNIQKNHCVIRCPQGLQQLAKANFIGTSGVMIRKSVLDECGTFDDELLNGDDYDLWLRISRRYSIAFIDRPLHGYRVGHQSISKAGAVRLGPSKIRVLKKQLRDPINNEFSLDIKRWISKNYALMAREFLYDGAKKLSIKNSLTSIKYFPNYEAFKILAMTIAGINLVNALKIVRDRAKNFMKKTSV